MPTTENPEDAHVTSLDAKATIRERILAVVFIVLGLSPWTWPGVFLSRIGNGNASLPQIVIGLFFSLLGLLMHPSALLCIAAGVGIWNRRDWGYWIGYFGVALSMLYPASVLVAALFRTESLVYLGNNIGTVMAALISSGVILAALIYVSRVRPVQESVTRNVPSRANIELLKWLVGVSGFIVVAFVVLIAIAWIDDPPGPGGPACPDGGLFVFLILFLGWPIYLPAIIGLVVFSVLLWNQTSAQRKLKTKRISPRDRKRVEERDSMNE